MRSRQENPGINPVFKIIYLGVPLWVGPSSGSAIRLGATHWFQKTEPPSGQKDVATGNLLLTHGSYKSHTSQE
jgi:hypothetical protein